MKKNNVKNKIAMLWDKLNKCMIRRRVFIASAIILYLLIVIGRYVCHFKSCTPSDYTADWGAFGSYVGGMTSIISIGLLYLTLKSQNDAIKKQDIRFEKERFETTFFNLIENHRKFIESIRFKALTFDQNGNNLNYEVNSENFFRFSCKEIHRVTDILKREQYPTLSNVELQSEVELIEYELEEVGDDMSRDYLIKKKETAYYEFSLSWRCNIYNLTKEKWGQIKQSDSNIRNAYKIFYEKWKNYYSPYFRSLLLLFSYIEGSGNEEFDKANYYKYITYQMTNHEIFLVKNHAYYDKAFNKVLEMLP